MVSTVRKSTTKTQQEGRKRRGSRRCVDIHCHCLPGLDDGPATMDDAMALCRALVRDGIDTAIATPHQLGRYDGCNGPDVVRQAVLALNSALSVQDVALAVVAGADVRADERIPRMLGEKGVLTLADVGRHLLLELPHETFIDLGPLLAELASRDVKAIISHPERNDFLMKESQFRTAMSWREHGATFQVTAASLAGDFGRDIERAAWHWMNTGAAALVATDAHDIDVRRPRMSAAMDLIDERLGHEATRRVCIENPLRVLTGQDIVPLPCVIGLGGRT